MNNNNIIINGKKYNKNLITLNLSNNQLIILPPEIGALINLDELDLLNNHLVMEAKEIQIELLNNGFKSVSKTLLGDIYGRLSQLVSDGKIITFKDGKNFKKYKIATSQTNL